MTMDPEGFKRMMLSSKPKGPVPDEGPVFELKGDGSFAVEVVGESHYLGAFVKFCGARDEEGVDLLCEAELVLEDSNPHDSRAVRIDLAGDTVGHLSREGALRFRRALSILGIASARRVRCPARISGGWDRGDGDTGYFGVRLDLDLDPPRKWPF